MRNCLVAVLLLLLLLGNGYALFEIHLLQGEVARLSHRVEGRQVSSPEEASLPDLVAEALKAVQRGDPISAGLALDRFTKRVQETRSLAEARRQQLEKAAAQAKQAAAGKEKEAEAALQRLLREVSAPTPLRKATQK